MELLSRDRTICDGLFDVQRVGKGQLSRSNTLSSGRRVTDRQVSALEFGGPLIKVNLPRRCRAGTAGNDPKETSWKQGRGSRWSAATSPVRAVDHSTTRVGLRATG